MAGATKIPLPHPALARAENFCARYGLRLPILLAPMAYACQSALCVSRKATPPYCAGPATGSGLLRQPIDNPVTISPTASGPKKLIVLAN